MSHFRLHLLSDRLLIREWFTVLLIYLALHCDWCFYFEGNWGRGGCVLTYMCTRECSEVVVTDICERCEFASPDKMTDAECRVFKQENGLQIIYLLKSDVKLCVYL